MNHPSTPNQVAAIKIIAPAMRDRPSPSRRTAGSSSLAPRPIPRAAPPAKWAIPVQMRPIARTRLPKALGTGPGLVGPDFLRLERAGVLRLGLLFALLREDPRVRVDVREAIGRSVPTAQANSLQSHTPRVSQILTYGGLVSSFDPDHNRNDHGAATVGGSDPFTHNFARFLGEFMGVLDPIFHCLDQGFCDFC